MRRRKFSMLTISLQDQQLLAKQANQKKLETNVYLTDITNDNYKYIKSKFFLYDTDSKAQLLNIGSWLFGTVADVLAFYVGSPDYDFDITFDNFIRDLVTLGFFCMTISRIDWQERIGYEEAKNYWNDNWIHKTSRLYEDEQGMYYVLVSSYLVGTIENKLYRMAGTSLTGGVQVPLDTIRQTSGLQDIVQTWLNIPALIVIEESDYSTVDKIKSLVYGVDRQVVMNHTQYLQNVESFILFKNITRPEKLLQDYNSGKKIDFSQIGRIINGWDDSQIEFIDNVNTLIDKSITDTNNYIRRISSISTVPIEFLWIESSEWAVGEGSRTLRHGAFMKKVQYYRDLLDMAITIFMEETNNTDTYTRPDIFAKSSKELADELKTARESNIISQYTAIKKYNWYNDKETTKELALINSETDEQSEGNRLHNDRTGESDS